MPDVHTERHHNTESLGDDKPQNGSAAQTISEVPCSLTLPGKPTASMLAAGARAGNVSVEVAWRVYQAMITAT